MANPSATWEALGESDGDQVFYRRQELYSMLWSVRDLSDFRISAARKGGPVVMIRDDRKPVLLPQNGALGRPKLTIYSSAGSLLKTIKWDSPARIIALGWTGDERLVVLTDDGSYRLYELSTATSLGKSDSVYSQHSLGPDVAEAGILEAVIHEDGIVALLASGSPTFYELRGGWDDGQHSKVVKLVTSQALQQAERIHCWTIVPSTATSTRSTEVLCAVADTVYRLDEIDCSDTRFNRGPFSSIEPSPSGRFLSVISSATSTLYVTSIDFRRSLSEFDLAKEAEQGASYEKSVPSQAWSGDNTVVVAWERKVIMVGPFGECLRYVYADPVHLVGELDGCRILSSNVSHFLQLVPQATQDIFRPGSTAPSAILYTASELYAQKSPKADDYVRSIRDKLVQATESCLEAASREWDIDWQKRLLKAASFGKGYLDNYNPTEYVNVGRTLRILNACRYYEVGIPISWDQYSSSTPSELIDRLLNRSLHLLALRISASLSLSTAPVISHWASYMIQSSTLPEDQLAQTIVSRLRDQGTNGHADGLAAQQLVPQSSSVSSSGVTWAVSTADIALTAFKYGKASLAKKLLEREERIEKVPPAALVMNEDDLALRKALQTGDTNIVNEVLIAMRRRRDVGDFLRAVSKKPEAYALLETYARENDVQLLRDFYFQDDRRKETALLSIDEALAHQDVGDKLVALRDAYKSFNEDKDCAFEARACDEHVRLLTLQEQLDHEAGSGSAKSFVGMSVNETIRACLGSNAPALAKRADKVRSDFKVPDKRFWYVAMNAYVSVGDWDALWKLATSKSSSPIGYEPFVHALLAAGAQRQAIRYVEKCDTKDRIELYVKCGEWLMAGHECVRRAERGKLIELRSRVPNNTIKAQLDDLLEQLGGPSAK